MNKNTYLLFGGFSSERLVSTASAQCILSALPFVQPFFWSKKGPIFNVTSEDLLEHKDPFTKEFIPKNTSTYDSIDDASLAWQNENIILILAVHGIGSEDGYLQSILEKNNILFTGSSAKASALAFNKIKSCEILSKYNFKTSPSKTLNTSNKTILKEDINSFLNEHDESIIKPVSDGSTIDCFFISKTSNIDEICDYLQQKQPKNFFIEKKIIGREITISVIENDDRIESLPPTEIILDKNRVFDYDGKYLSKGSKEITPANLSLEELTSCNRVALAAHAALGLFGYSRTDIILTDSGPYFLEVNSLPGLSEKSLLPQQLAVKNISMREFLLGQINLLEQKNIQ